MFRFLFPLLYLALIAYALIDLLNSKKTTEQKFIWVAVILFFPVAGAVIYLLISRGVIRM
jgi:hypothetical protein